MTHIFRTLSVLCFLTGGTSAHYIPMIADGTPKAPPTLDPGPDAALLRVTILDSVSGKLTSATVSVNDGKQEPDRDPYRQFSLRNAANRHKGPIRFRDIPYYFFTDGQFEVRVPAGVNTISVGKGYEYQERTVSIRATKGDTVDLSIGLNRTIDMAARGWYSGDTHIHMDRTESNSDTLLKITSAKDVRYAYLLSMNTGGYDRGGEKFESYRQAMGLGDRSVLKLGPYHITSGQEYRTGNLGHVTIDLPDAYVRANGYTDSTNAGPSLGVIADQAHTLNGFIGLAHGGYHHQEADALLLDDKMDFIELLQFGGYRSLGLDGWYDFLNIGYRIPIVGVSDYPPTRELSSEITYVWSNSVPSPRTYLERLSAGHSFATSGPMVLATVGGRKPGEILKFTEQTDTTLSVAIDVHSPLYPVKYLEVIRNGRVLEREYDPDGKTSWAHRTTVAIRETGWIAVRTYADAGTDAHTNPVYVYVGDRHRFDADSARNIIARLDGSLSKIQIPQVTRNMQRLRSTLVDMLGGSSGDLPLPKIP